MLTGAPLGPLHGIPLVIKDNIDVCGLPTTVASPLFTHAAPAKADAVAVARLRAAGAQDVANDIVVVSGPLPVDELNKCLWVSGYVRRMFSRLATLPHGKLQRPAEPFRKAA